MKIMKNLKIKSKLLLGLWSLNALIIIISILSALFLIGSNNRTNEMFNKNVIAAETLGEIESNFQKQWSLLRNLILFDEKSPVYKKTVEALSSSNTEIMKHFDEYQKTTTEKKLVSNFNSIKILYTTDFSKLKTKLLDLTSKNLKDDAKQALALAEKVSLDSEQMLTSITALDKKYAQNSLETSKTKFKLSLMIFGSIAVFAIIWVILITKYFDKLISYNFV